MALAIFKKYIYIYFLIISPPFRLKIVSRALMVLKLNVIPLSYVFAVVFFSARQIWPDERPRILLLGIVDPASTHTKVILTNTTRAQTSHVHFFC